MTINEFMATHAAGYIGCLASRTVFTSRDFILYAISKNGNEFIPTFNEDHENPVRTMNAKVGEYLSEHSDELGIAKLTSDESDVKVSNGNPFGDLNPTQLWIKK